MDAKELEHLTELVTRRVLETLGKMHETVPQGATETWRMLVIGVPSRIPGEYIGSAILCPVEDYRSSSDILRYQKVLVERLTLTQLADIVAGRETDKACSAVLQALLQGVEVWMLEDAPPHRRSLRCNSGALCQMLENYVQTLLRFGVRLLPGSGTPSLDARSAVMEYKSEKSGLITEAEALRLAERGERELRLPAGTILTPSARDVFVRTRVALVWEPPVE